MKSATVLLRIVLGLEGVILILRTPQIIAALNSAVDQLGIQLFRSYWSSLAPNLHYGMPLLGMCCLITVWGMLSGKRWAQRAGIVVSAVHTILFPFFTPLGLLGLYTLHRDRLTLTLEKIQTRWQEPVPTELLPSAFRLLVGLAIAIMAGSLYFLVNASQKTSQSEFLEIWTIPVALALVNVILVMVHDAGSNAAGIISGFRIEILRMGFLQLERSEAGKWAWKKRDRTVWQHLRAGVRTSSLTPISDDDRIDSRLFIYQCGGPFAEFALGLVFLAGMIASPKPAWTEMLGLACLLAFGRFVLELALMRNSDEEYTDGARLVQLWNRDPEGERWCVLHSIAQSQGRQPIAPGQWPESWVLRISADPESPVYPAGCFYAYAHYLDRGNLDKAKEYLDRLRHIKGWTQQERVVVEITFFEAFTGTRNAAIVEGAQVLNRTTAAAKRMEAMLLISEGFMNDAVLKIEEARKLFGHRRRRGGGWERFEQNLLQQMEDRITAERQGRSAGGNSLFRLGQQLSLPPAEADAPATAATEEKPVEFAEIIRRTSM
ncbi:hypothetical protein F183_A17070 [Bryobacterales bacterium F-183]|nr:hypothetical protein F183_A17070 [Bryobacterales bacterium F-183]